MMDIVDKADVKVFVDAFYDEVRNDATLGPVFAAKIAADNWQPHLEKMYSFWNTVLFGVPDYRGNPFSKHASLPIQPEHFKRWTQLLFNTLDQKFRGDKADEVKMRALKMSKLFQSKLAYIRGEEHFKNVL